MILMIFRVWEPQETTGNVSVIVCAHGLTRNKHDFAYVAERLMQLPQKKLALRVVSFDFVGRGESDWLQDPTGYNYAQYMSDVVTLISRVTHGQPAPQGITWIGSSMGALVGMMLAAKPNSPIKQLVMNDAGPLVPAAAIANIARYVGKAPSFASHFEAEAYLRSIYSSSWGPTTDAAFWTKLAQTSSRTQADGNLALTYDPRIALNFGSATDPVDVDLWHCWEALRPELPVLVLHGVDSTVLPHSVAQRMAQRPLTRVVDFVATGHLPPLYTDDSGVGAIVEWLQQQQQQQHQQQQSTL